MAARPAFEIGGKIVAPGSRRTVDLPVSILSDHTPVTLSVHVVHGRRDGPTMFVSAAIHGDEVIGAEIVRRLLRHPALDRVAGTVLAVPIVNTFGFLNHSRYLPDRRDLNRSFPGSPRGSLAARLAHLFMNEVVARCDVGIDLHSAAIHRTNLPQVRVSPGRRKQVQMAQLFAAPVVMTSKVREGSLRQAAADIGVDVLLYEAGEGLRFDEMAARAGVTGILRVMHGLGMIGARGISRAKARPLVCTHSVWVRAPRGGLLRGYRSTGDTVKEGEVLGAVADPFGERESEIEAPVAGVIVGRAIMPIINEGDALFHIAEVKDHAAAEETVETLTEQLDGEPMFDEDEII